jgi:hypothetical protein
MHLSDRGQRFRKVEQRIERQHNVEGPVRKPQLLGIHLSEHHHIAQPESPSLGGSLFQHPRRVIDPDDAPVRHERPRAKRHEARSRPDVQHMIRGPQLRKIEDPHGQWPIESLGKAVELCHLASS